MKLVVPLVPPNDTTSKGATELGFSATWVTIENPTPFYWFLPDEQRYIPPQMTGVVIKLYGVQQARIISQAPPGLQQTTILAGSAPGTALFTYLDDEDGAGLQPSPGVALAGVQSAPLLALRTVVIVGGNVTVTDLFPIPCRGVSISHNALVAAAARFEMDYSIPQNGSNFYNIFRHHSYNPANTGVNDLWQRIYRVNIPAGASCTLSWGGAGQLTVFVGLIP